MEKLLFEAAHLGEEEQREFLQKISQFCTVEEVTAIAIGVAYFRQLIDKDLHDHMQAELCKAFLEEVNA